MKEIVWILLLLGVCCCQAQDYCKFEGEVCSWSATTPVDGTLDACMATCQNDGTCLALTLRTGGGTTTCSYHTEACGANDKVLNPGQATDFVYTKLGNPGLSESECNTGGGSIYTVSSGAGGPPPYLLVIEDREITSVSLDGVTRKTVLTGNMEPNNLAVSSVSGYVFYSDAAIESIHRAKLDGSGVKAIITDVEGPYGLMVLDRVERLFWSDTSGGVVESSDYDGNNRMVMAKDLPNVLAIAIDDSNSKLYFITNLFIGEVLLDGSNFKQVTTEIQRGMETTVLIHSPSRTVFFHNRDQATIMAINIDQGDQNPDVDGKGEHRVVAKRAAVQPDDTAEQEVLTREQAEQNEQNQFRVVVDQIQACLGLAVVNYLGEDQLFYTDSLETLRRVSVAGGAPEIVREGLNAPGRIAVVDPSVYVDPGLSHLTSEALDAGAIKFTCSIAVRDDGHDQFQVVWKSDAVVLETSDVTGHVSTLTMTNAEAGQRGLGRTLVCEVRTRTVAGGQTTLGPAVSSNVWRAKCEVQPSALNLVEGVGSGAIEVKCNAPPASFGGDFSLHVELVRVTNELRTADGKVLDQVVVEAQEGSTSHVVRVTADNWWLTFTFKCKAVIDGKVESIQESIRQMRVIQTVSDGHITIDTVTIRIRDRDRYSVCSAVNDPHCRSADGRSFECQAQGAFVFYRSKIFNYQIVLVFQPCSTWGPSPTCTCAVFIQVDSLVWVFHKCITAGASPYATPLNIYVLAPAGPIVPNVQIIQIASAWGTKYYVIMPHGGVLSVTFSMGFLNAYYAPSPADWNNMCGLCGNFDGNIDNDFMMRDGTLHTPANSWSPTDFVNEWRMSAEESVITGVAAVEEDSVEERIYCSVMEETGEVCVPGMDVVAQETDPDDDDIAAEIVAKFKFTSDPNNRNKFAAPAKRKKRAAETTYTGFDPYAPIVADLEHVPTAASWPTPLGRTEAEVTSFCTNSINDHAGVGLCSTMLNDNFADVITECIWDIQSTDNLDWVDQAIAGILKRCTIHADKVDNSAADGDPPPALPNGVDRAALFAAVCPNDCSGNGTCTDGACSCTGDYVGADCSMHLSDPPEVTVLFETFCNLSSRSCAEAIVFGDKFHNRPTLTCHIQEYTLGDPLPTGPATSVLAQFTKFDQIACPMPAGHRPHVLQVSNDGTNMAAAKRLFAPHHLNCFSCSMAGDITTATCVRKPRTCLIGGSCYQDGDANPDGGCGTCDSAKSNSSWSGCGLSLGVIIGIVAAAIVGVIVLGVLVGVAYYFIKQASKPSTPETKLVRRVSTDGKVHPGNYA